MNKIILMLSIVGLLIACDKNDKTDNGIELNANSFLVFGHFYGECGGESCVETFKLTDQNVFEDTIDDYSGQNLDFVALDNQKFELVNDLLDAFPNQLLSASETTFGCPDCADGGGLFIQYSDNGSTKSWRIDQNKDNVPSYMRNFIDQVNAKIAVLNN